MSRENRNWAWGSGRVGWWMLGLALGVACMVYWGLRSSRAGGVERWMAERREQGERFTIDELGLDRRPGYVSGVMDVVDAVAGAMKQFQNPAGPTESYRLEENWGWRVVLWREPPMISVAGFRAEGVRLVGELDGVGAELERVRQAVEVIVDDPGGALYPPQLKFNPVGARMVAQVLSDAVVLELHRGRPAEALEDLVALIRLARQHGEDPVWFNQSFRLRVSELAVGGVWQLLERDGWEGEQLVLLRDELMGLELVSGFLRAAEVERAIALEYARELERGAGGGAGVASSFSPSLHAWRMFGREEDLMYLLRSYEAFLVGAREFESGGRKWGVGRGLVTGGAGDLELGLGARWLGRLGFHYHYLVSGLIMPNLGRSAELLVSAETWRRMAVTWLEVELFQLERGAWPEGLAVLPGFDGDERWRVDPFSGEPFQYRLREGKRPLLYSVGKDGVDGGGEAGESANQGDWVWPEPVGEAR